MEEPITPPPIITASAFLGNNFNILYRSRDTQIVAIWNAMSVFWNIIFVKHWRGPLHIDIWSRIFWNNDKLCLHGERVEYQSFNCKQAIESWRKSSRVRRNSEEDIFFHQHQHKLKKNADGRSKKNTESYLATF